MGCDELNCDLLKCCVVFFLSTRQVGEEEVRSCFALKIFQGRRGAGGGAASGGISMISQSSLMFLPLKFKRPPNLTCDTTYGTVRFNRTYSTKQGSVGTYPGMIA